MNKWGLLGLGLLALAFFAVNSAKQAIIDGLNFISAKISKPSFKLNQINHTITLTYSNTGPVALSFDAFSGALYYGKYLLAYLNVPNPVSLPPNQNTAVVIDGVIKYADLVGNILDLVRDNAYLNGLALKGSVTIGGIKVPVDYPLQLI